ncbi:hypothetical protein MTR_5g095755 [Medicago truncatula]|uniref:Uncharacterized protein n=1 Tax=Medicago truncatula TaxID=3880 RepID=A0A072UH73_MEDTR|nr:hypothetical protein MTR_5g095755 [Medicago truncatula]
MFTPKANSKQKRVKKTQERETEDAVKVQLARRICIVFAEPRRTVKQKNSRIIDVMNEGKEEDEVCDIMLDVVGSQ